MAEIIESRRTVYLAQQRAYELVGRIPRGAVPQATIQGDVGPYNPREGMVNGWGFFNGRDYYAVRIDYDPDKLAHINVRVAGQSYAIKYISPLIQTYTPEQFTTRFAQKLTDKVRERNIPVYDAFAQTAQELGEFRAFSVHQLSTAISLHEFTNRFQIHTAHIIPSMTLSANDSPPSLMDLISTPDGKPATPSTSNIIVVPQSLLDDTSQKQALFPYVQLLSSYSAAAAAALVYKNNPNGFDISTAEGKFAATNAMANATWEILTRGLSGFYVPTKISAYQHTINNSEQTFHSQFLNTLFKAFAFPGSVMTELDVILTTVNDDLISFSRVHMSETEKLSHIINITTCEKDPTFGVWVAVSHFFLLSIDMASMYSVWKSGKGTASQQSYSFNLNYLTTDSTMNASLVASKQQLITEYLDKMLGNQLAAVEKIVSPKAIVNNKK